MRSAAFARRALAALGLLANPACTHGGPAHAGAGDAGLSPAPPRPASCIDVAPGEALQGRIDGAAAVPGAALCLGAGTHRGPVRLSGPITVWGPREAQILSAGTGTTVVMVGDGPTLLGVTVDGSGGRFDMLDAAVHVTRARRARVEGVRVVNATFGVLVESSERVIVRGNDVSGAATTTISMRGDGIRFWETNDSIIEANHVRDSRDLVVWYSYRNKVIGNLVERSRYGTHLMHSDDNEVSFNRFMSDEVSVFVMYSRNVEVRGNVLADATGAAGIGLGIKESGNLRVLDNQIVHDTVGAFIDTSPLQPGDTVLFENNAFRIDQVGIAFHGPIRGCRFLGNELRDNQTQVTVGEGDDALAAEWTGNGFDDYAGWDADGDGVGDVPYELRSLANQLTNRYPAVSFFSGTPVLSIVEVAGRAVPLLQPRTILRDPRPRMSPLPAGGTRARRAH